MANCERLIAVPVPRYSIGATVFSASVKFEAEKFSCPDCLRTGRWNVRSPVGLEAMVECPRCRGTGVLDQEGRVAQVLELTVGSIQINTAGDYDDKYIRYMCNETGVGSGTIWSEDSLFSSREEALLIAERRTEEARLELDKRDAVKRTEFRSLSAYQIVEAATMESESKRRHAEYRVQYLLERIAELKPDQYLYVQESDWEDDETRTKDDLFSSTLSLTAPHVRLLQEHLMSHSNENVKWLKSWRHEEGKCKC